MSEIYLNIFENDSPSAKMASGHAEVKAAACFTIDKIKDNFRNLGVYIDDDYSESFVTLSMLEKRTTPFSFVFNLKGDGIDVNGKKLKTLKGKALYNKALSKSMKTVVLDFQTTVNDEKIELRIYFSKKGKNSINRVFFTEKKALQKLRQRTDNVIVGLQKGGIFDVKIQVVQKSPKLDADQSPEVKKMEQGSTIKDSKGVEFIIKNRRVRWNKEKKPFTKIEELQLQKKDGSGKEFWVPKDKLENFVQTENFKNIKKLISEGLNLLLENAENLKTKYQTYTILLKTIGIDTSLCDGGSDKEGDVNEIPSTKNDSEKLNVRGKFKPTNDFIGDNLNDSDKRLLTKISNELEQNITGDGMLLSSTKDGITLSLSGKPEEGFVHISPKVKKSLNIKDLRTYKNVNVWVQPKSFMTTNKGIGGILSLELID